MTSDFSYQFHSETIKKNTAFERKKESIENYVWVANETAISFESQSRHMSFIWDSFSNLFFFFQKQNINWENLIILTFSNWKNSTAIRDSICSLNRFNKALLCDIYSRMRIISYLPSQSHFQHESLNWYKLYTVLTINRDEMRDYSWQINKNEHNTQTLCLWEWSCWSNWWPIQRYSFSTSVQFIILQDSLELYRHFW